MRFDLTDLSLFRHIVEAGSITHGAERANLALAAASTRVRNMEEALGAPLLVRGRHGAKPTQAGRTLLQHARTILPRPNVCARISAPMRAGWPARSECCRTPTRSPSSCPRLELFLAAHPNVSVDLEERLSDEIVGLIAEGVGDIGIVAGTVDTSRLTTYPFRSDRFVLVVARGHPLARLAKIGFAEVLDHDFVGLDRASALQRFLADKAARIGRPLKLRVQLRSFDAVCRLVERNVGVGIVPETTTRWAAKSMAIKVVDLTDAWAVRDLTICIRDLRRAAALCAATRRSHARGRALTFSARHQRPVIEIENDGRVVIVALPERKIGARFVLGGDGAQPQRADVGAAGQCGAGQHLGPGKHRVAGKQRRHMPPAVDCRDMKGIGQAVEGQRPRQRDDMPAIDQPAAEASFGLGEQVEMDPGIVLIEPGGDLMLRLLDRHPVDMIDLFADAIIGEAVR